MAARHLLNHTSGIREYFEEADFLQFARSEYMPEEIVKRASASPPAFTPGAKWAYSSTGYDLLGMIIEKAGGKPYGEFLSERIFRPLGMTATRNSDPNTVIPDRASGYAWTKGTFFNCAPITATAGWAAGSL
ncbi:MAG: beta-lactamase family protein [Armatimonadetes bacterium]|nr:beta-lactamase family protein [Armatimonadota bacterium]